MRRLAVIAAACGLLAACDSSIFADSPPPPLPGKRISVLAHSKALEADTGAGSPIILPDPEKIASWPQAGGVPTHDLHRVLLAGSSLHMVWSADLGTGGDKRRPYFSQPVVADGKVFAMDAASTVSAYRLSDGERLWRVDLTPDDVGDGSFGGGLAYDDGKLFATTGFAQAVALDPAQGKILWRHNLSAPAPGAPTVHAGRVLLITVDNETKALSADDGHELWHHNGMSEMAMMVGGTSPAVEGNTVLAPYTSGELFALRIENGTVQWSEMVSSIRRTDQVAELTDIRGLPVVDHGRVYAAGNADIVAAIDLRTGRRIWDRDVGSIQTPWVAGDYMYLITNAPDLVCFDATSGKVHWVTSLPTWEDEKDKEGRIIWSGPILASDRLILTSSAGKAVSFSPYTGAKIGEEELPGGVSIPPIVADGTLILVTRDAKLLAYR